LPRGILVWLLSSREEEEAADEREIGSSTSVAGSVSVKESSQRR